MTNSGSGLDPGALATVLAAWLPGQRWFAGKQRMIGSIRAGRLGVLGSAPAEVEVWVAVVSYADGAQETYQLPLRTGPAADTGEHGRIGEVVTTDGAVVGVYDAVWDRASTQAWLGGFTDPATDTAAHGITFHRTADVEAVPVGAPSKVLTGEQSNTSVVFGDRAILKVFRRLETGINPDIEIHEALGRVGGRHIARMLGFVTAQLGGGAEVLDGARIPDGGLVNLAMLQDFMSTATDGWELAKNSVRDLMAEGDLHASEAGGDFAAEAFRLGVATAEVHAGLAEAFGRRELDRAQLQARAEEMSVRLDEALLVVPRLGPLADALRTNYQALATADPIIVQRVHGDLHLGQVLRTVQRWVVLDFEGEPVKSIASRREMDSPLRDVAGMLRSFDYAANHQIIDAGSDNQRRYRSIEWADRNRAAFQAGYLHAGGADGAIDPVLLRAFEADKAVYEAVYEARNRPAWLAVPLASLDRLATPAVTASADREDTS